MLELLKQYAGKRIDLLKLEATEKSVSVAGIAAVASITALFGLFFLILLLVGLGLVLGRYLDNYGLGVLIMAAFCLLLIVLVFLLRKTIKDKVANSILKMLED